MTTLQRGGTGQRWRLRLGLRAGPAPWHRTEINGRGDRVTVTVPASESAAQVHPHHDPIDTGT